MKNRLSDIFRVALAFALMLTVSLAVTACAKDDGYEIFGFSVEEEISVEAGHSVKITCPVVTDSYGNSLQVDFAVKDADGNKVATELNAFYATDERGYTIEYTVTPVKGEVKKLTTRVKVSGNITLTVSSRRVYDVGETATITPVCKWENARYEYAVEKNGNAVNVIDAKFEITETGIYNVTVTASKDGRETSFDYEVLARVAAESNEIEGISSDWEKARELNDFGVYGWSYTASTSVKDPFGNDGEFAVKTVNSAAESGNGFRVYLDARKDKSYYTALAAEGYTDAAMWMYTPCNGEFSVSSYMSVNPYDTGAVVRGTLTKGVWTLVTMPLMGSKNNGFTDGYDDFKSQLVYPFKINQASDPVYPMTAYISGAYAKKILPISAVKSAKSVYEIGETVDLDGLFAFPSSVGQADVEKVKIVYCVYDERGERHVLPRSEYRFMSNGRHRIEAIVTDKDNASVSSVYGNKQTSVYVNVTDNVQNAGESIVKPVSSAPVDIALTDFNIAPEYNGTPIEVTDITVFDRNGNPVEANGGSFRADGKKGFYTVSYRTEYTVGSDTFGLSRELAVDFGDVAAEWNDCTDLSFVTANYWGSNVTGITANEGYYTVSRNSTTHLALRVIPVHSKQYYAKYSDSKLTCEAEVTASGKETCAFSHWGIDYNESRPANKKFALEFGIADLLDDWDNVSLGRVNFVQFRDESNTEDITLSVGNFKIVNPVPPVSGDATFVDKHTSATVDLTELLNTEGNEVLGNKDANDEATFTLKNNGTAAEYSFTGATADLTDVSVGSYTLVLKLNGNPVHANTVDIASTQNPVWQDDITLDNAAFVSWSGSVKWRASVVSGLEVDRPESEVFFKYTTTDSNADYLGFVLIPCFGKAYYEAVIANNPKLVLSFDVCYILTDIQAEQEAVTFRDVNDGQTKHAQKEWFTVRVSIADLVANYDAFTAATPTKFMLRLRDQTSVKAFSMYIGNFKFETLREMGYTAEYYLENENGEFVKSDELSGAVTSYDGKNTVVGDTVEIERKAVAGYYIDVQNEQNITRGTITESGLILKLYYKRYTKIERDLGLTDVSTTSSVNKADVPDGLTEKLYKLSGSVRTEVSVDLTGDAISLVGLNGAYVYEATMPDGTVMASVTFDVYDSTATTYEWQNETDTKNTAWAYWGTAQKDRVSVVDGDSVGLSAEQKLFAYDSGNNKDQISFKLLPAHSKSYYEAALNKDADLALSFYVYYTLISNDSANKYVFRNHKNGQIKYEQKIWFEVSVPLSELIADFDNFATYGKSPYMIALQDGAVPARFNIYFGGFKLAAPAAIDPVNTKTLLNKTQATDLSEWVNVSELVKMNLEAHANDVVWTFVSMLKQTEKATYTVTGNTGSLADVATGVYTLTAKIGETELCSATADVYDPTAFEWYDFEQLSATPAAATLGDVKHRNSYGVGVGSDQIIDKFGSVNLSTVSASDESLPDCNGTFVKVEYDGTGTVYNYVGFVAMHTKAYYELFKDKSFTFSFVTTKGFNANAKKGYIIGVMSANTKYTGTVSVQALLDDWDNASVGKHYFVQTAWTNVASGSFYFGEFKTVEA